MPGAKFLHDMGVASIVAGVILLGLAKLVKAPRKIKRAARRTR